MKLSIFEGIPLFRLLSYQTKYKILYEFSKIKVCQPGHIIKEMDPRSPWNYKYRSQYANHKPIIQHIRDPDQLGLDTINSQ